MGLIKNKKDGFKNCEVSEILPYLQANRLACHSFMDAGRRHETFELQKGSLLFLTMEIPRVSVFVFSTSSPNLN